MNEELAAVPGETVRGRLDKVRGSQKSFGEEPSLTFLDAEEQRAYGEHSMYHRPMKFCVFHAAVCSASRFSLCVLQSRSAHPSRDSSRETAEFASRALSAPRSPLGVLSRLNLAVQRTACALCGMVILNWASPMNPRLRRRPNCRIRSIGNLILL